MIHLGLNRYGGAPRSVLILTALLLIAGGALFLNSHRDSAEDFTLGGRLFPVEPGDIEGLLLTSGGSQIRLDLVDGRTWSLSGAVTDYVDTLAVLKLLDTLAGAHGGPLLPGTEVEDRRYEFNGPAAIRLTVFVTGGDPVSLAIGAGNPVGGNFYGSGAGRDACFMVPAILRKALGDLPGAIQAKKLLPGVTRDKVAEIEIRRGDRDFQVKRRNGRWWMLMPAEGPAYLGPEVRDYQAMYGDRREADGEGTWILASSAAVEKMIYEVSDIVVGEIKSPTESAALIETWNLDPPWRRVTLMGQGLNPDPAADSPDRMVIAFGPALTREAVPVLRRGNVLTTSEEALFVLEQPLGILAHRTGLTFQALKSDVITLEREGRLLLHGTRTGTALTPEGRLAWLTEFPEAGIEGLKEKHRHGLIQDLVVNLDRLEVLAVLSPTSDASILTDRERVKISISFGNETGTGENIRSEIIEIGYLDEDRLPADSPPLVRAEDDSPPVGLWFHSDGKLLQVPAHFIVTARAMSHLVPDSSSR
ncbi:MAG: DUF4340 domain-containing protein [Candidatus Krumholzibacteriota bacterium]